MNIVVNRYRNITYLKDTEVDLKLTEYKKVLAKRVYFLSYIHIFYKRCIVLDETKVHYKNKFWQGWMFFLINVFRLYPGIKKSFENNSARKNLFVSACFCWDSRLSLREMD